MCGGLAPPAHGAGSTLGPLHHLPTPQACPHVLCPGPQVIAVGPGREDGDKEVKPQVSVGSTVLYQKYAGTEFEGADDKQYIVVRDADIMAALA